MTVAIFFIQYIILEDLNCHLDICLEKHENGIECTRNWQTCNTTKFLKLSTQSLLQLLTNIELVNSK